MGMGWTRCGVSDLETRCGGLGQSDGPGSLEGNLGQILGSAGCWAGSGDLQKGLKQEITGASQKISPLLTKCQPPVPSTPAVFSFSFFNEELDQPFPQPCPRSWCLEEGGLGFRPYHTPEPEQRRLRWRPGLFSSLSRTEPVSPEPWSRKFNLAPPIGHRQVS